MDLNKLHNELLEQLTTEEARTLRAEMQELFSTNGWNKLAKYLEIHYRSKVSEIAAQPLSGMDAALGQEYQKGECNALLVFLNLPAGLHDFAEDQINATQTEIEDEGDGWETDRI